MNNTKQKSALLRERIFVLAGAEGLEPSTHGFGGNAVQRTACRKITVFQQK